ncbi:sensor histidine kinase [Candidatus Albibeggiatoa sp. nov. NOAA]|uniref:sensor histidine kinase n=1 Tax=Candidatus Albibeggiatoa sp. nov. NOAA TaxID=3162724 RepID=UPI0032F5BE3E|nr:sensor histidine kinase [Thiotrichaceae bacterium]
MLLRTKILLTLAPLVILPLLGIGWIGFDKLKSTHEETIFHQMTTLLNQVELHVASHKNTVLANIELFAGSEVLEKYASMPDYERYTIGLLSVMELFSSYNKAYPDYYEIRVLLLDGYEDVRFTLDDDIPNLEEDESETDYFLRIQAQNEQVFSEYLISPDIEQTILLVSKPLYYKDLSTEDVSAKPSLRAYLLISVKLDFIQQLVDTTTIGKEGLLFLTDKNGSVVFGSNAFPTGFQLPPTLFNNFQHHNEPSLSEINDQNWLFRAKQLDNNLFLVTALPEQELLQEAESLASIVINILVFTTIITVALLLIVLNYLVVAPVLDLRKAAKRIEQGELDVHLTWFRYDEIGFLAKQFESMAKGLRESKESRDQAQHQLEQLNQELEQRVQKRTVELENANQDLVRLNQEKNEFLGIAAHDLKNPLQAIQGSAELISMMSEDAELLEFANMISVSSERMFALITNLLDVNAIESGQVQLHVEDVNILPTLQRVVNEYTQKAQMKNIQIHFMPAQSMFLARVDESTVYQILDNLVSNAVKYSHHNKQVDIRITNHVDKVRVEIQDQGDGLSQDDQAKLFGKFKRLSTKPTGDEHSTGLGLFIVKKLVKALDAKVWCESELGNGACFIVEFVAVQDNAA